MTLEIGKEAPDFEARSTAGQAVKLSDYRGKKHVLLVFYPLAFSRTCTAEFCELRDESRHIVSDDVEVLGCSPDSAFTLKAWKAAEGYVNEFVSDFWPHGSIAQKYGVFHEASGTSMRGTFLIDKDGILRWMEVQEDWQARDQQNWRKALADLGVSV
ncbi:MAG TPA: peroxiredoxin [Actinomycetota bacterium]|nr:peroxiredoxin [Actinomycetota bacterium]